jgi:hypothetical protein
MPHESLSFAAPISEFRLKEALRQVAPGGCQEGIRANLAINAFAPLDERERIYRPR